MRAARYHSYGTPDVLVVEDAPEPHAAPGSVRIAVRAASVNPIDFLLRNGRLKDAVPLELPVVTGRDAVGVVDEVGEGVEGVQVGDVVFGLGGLADTTAEYAVLTAWSTVPEQWTTEQAAAAGLAAATAQAALDALADLVGGSLDGTTLLVEGASGAVGTAAVALALAAGATVIGTGSEANQEHLRALGALATTYGEGLAGRVAELAPGGVDAAFHSAPSDSLPALVDIVGDAARVVTVVDTEGAARLGALSVNARNDSDLLERAAAVGRAGGWTPRVDQVVTLDDAQRAHELAEGGGGKVVLTVRG